MLPKGLSWARRQLEADGSHSAAGAVVSLVNVRILLTQVFLRGRLCHFSPAESRPSSVSEILHLLRRASQASPSPASLQAVLERAMLTD